MKSLRSAVIEALVDSDFKPGEHEAYAYIYDQGLQKGRVGDFFGRQIDDLNWDNIEKTVAKIKGEING